MAWETAISPLAGLAGVVVGAWLSGRRSNRDARLGRAQHVADRVQDAAANLLAAVRVCRRWAMYSAPDGEMLDADFKFAKIDGRDVHDAAIDDAYTRLLVTTDSQAIRTKAAELTTMLNQFLDARVQFGRGKIPGQMVSGFRATELDFATTVRDELIGKT